MLHQKEDVKIKIYLSSTVSFTLSRSSDVIYINKDTAHLLRLADICTRIRGEANHQIKIFFLQAIVARHLSPTSSLIW